MLKLNQKISLRYAITAIVISLLILSACKPKAKLGTPGSISSTYTPPSSASTPAVTATPLVLAGATVMVDGLQYLEVVAGTGPAPAKGDVIVMNYIVTLPNGTEIYNTYNTNQPETAIWGRNQLLRGLEEGIGLMKQGGKAKFVLPPELALGSQGNRSIPPNSHLVMEVELLSVKPAPVPYLVSPDNLQVMPNGIMYYDITLGNGTEAITGTTVTTEYTIWVVAPASDDFVISSENSQPVTFLVGKGDKVFKGWEEGVIGMKIGGKRLLVIPADLAMGAQGGGPIPPNATLKMEIVLTDVQTPKTPTKVDENDYIVSPSGLKYYDIQVGTGITPTIGQTVVVNYIGWLENGTQFDSSYDRGQPYSFQFGMGKVITGWDLGLATMKVGGKRQLVIPASLAYGEQGAGSSIPPGATLIFEVELLEIKP